ncbi:bile acid:sodium symporter family protein [Jannaschia seohaensis]|uniref:BASS family bile acid:Na+ symporter n=1 Tax=Jannaschia seohaensis TaxID=475081 RepID=A0A2Y9BZH6_9RHOB|nr:bile acid:sodium symporter [Jannaschia seohaensis]PWJ20324.1 BASS family bile acid:Na+ symporter [Jannaschia seohaensis]SSA44362.1 bile acid:Na+ symporter, BASS family [Jannaschia seohaensis]
MTTETIIEVAVPVAVFVMMFALGLGLTLADFRSALARPRALLLGVLSQIVLVPIAGALFVSVLRQEVDLALGIVLLTLCPGAAMSNMLSRIAGGDVALSVSLTAVSNLLSAVTLPALYLLMAGRFLGADVTALAFGDLTLRVVIVATVPVLLGMAIRSLLPRVVERHEQAVFRICLAVFLAIIGWSFLQIADALQFGLALIGWQLVLLTFLLLGLGFALALLCGLSGPQRRTIAIETGVQNSGLGLAVGAMLWGDAAGFPLLAMPAVIYGAITYAVTFPVVILLSRAWRRA